MEKFIEVLSEQGPLVAVLVTFGIGMYRYFTQQLSTHQVTIKEKDKQIQKLNDEVREDAKENLKILSEFSSLLDKVISNTKVSEDKILETVKTLSNDIKTHIDLKIIEINKN